MTEMVSETGADYSALSAGFTRPLAIAVVSVAATDSEVGKLAPYLRLGEPAQ
jgi:uncharacterized NAD-dependent epimerase/dehydratase family protein